MLNANLSILYNHGAIFRKIKRPVYTKLICLTHLVELWQCLDAHAVREDGLIGLVPSPPLLPVGKLNRLLAKEGLHELK